MKYECRTNSRIASALHLGVKNGGKKNHIFIRHKFISESYDAVAGSGTNATQRCGAQCHAAADTRRPRSTGLVGAMRKKSKKLCATN